MGGSVSKLVYQPPLATYEDHPDEDFEVIWLRTKLGSDVPAFYIEAPRSKMVVLYSHGNAEDLGIAYDWARQFSSKLGVSVFAYDYTGYGLSEGKPTEKGTYADISAAYEHMTRVLEIPKRRIILYGRSLGSGPTVDLAHRLGPDGALGVVLHTPLASAFRVALNTGGLTLWGDMYPNIDKVSKISVPAIIMHGTADEVVPFKHGEQLHAKLKEPHEPWWVEGGLHNNLELKWRGEYYSRLREFFAVLSESLDGVSPMPVSEAARKEEERKQREREERRRRRAQPAKDLGEVLADDTHDDDDDEDDEVVVVGDKGNVRGDTLGGDRGRSGYSNRSTRDGRDSRDHGSRDRGSRDRGSPKRGAETHAPRESRSGEGGNRAKFRDDPVKYGRERGSMGSPSRSSASGRGSGSGRSAGGDRSSSGRDRRDRSRSQGRR